MGLFSDEVVTTVGTQVMRMIDDKAITSSINVGMMKSMYSEEPQMIEYVMEEMAGSIAYKADRMYAYAKKNYPIGVPSGQLKSATDGMDIVKAAIQSEIGGTINIDYMHVGQANLQHLGWIALIDQQKYDPVTNLLKNLTASKKQDVFLVDMTVVVKGNNLDSRPPSTLEQWGDAATAGYAPDRLAQVIAGIGKLRDQTPFEVDPSASSDYIKVKYAYGSGLHVTTEELKINLLSYSDEDEYYQVRYDFGSGLSSTGFWFYKVGSGLHPDVDNIHKTDATDHGTYFPFAYVRLNKTAVATGTPEYKATKKMVKYLGITYADIIKQVNENPNVKDVEQAFIAMMVPAVTENQMEKRYLFDYFKELFYASQEITPDAPINAFLWDVERAIKPDVQQTRTIIIQDKKFKMALTFGQITQGIKVGSVCDVGTYKSEFIDETKVQNPPTVNGGTVTWTTVEKHHRYVHQIAVGLYEEIEIFGLKMTYYVYGSYTTVGTDKDASLLIPLDMSITHNYQSKDRELLYSRSLHMIMNSRVITVLKWYQQSWFQMFLVAIMVVVTIYSMGSTWKELLASISAGVSAQAIAYTLFIALVKYVAVTIAIKLFVKAVGFKTAFLVALVAAAMGVYSKVTDNLSEMLSADNLLKLSTSLSKGIQTGLNDAMSSLQDEYAKIKASMDTEIKLLDDANKLLESDNKMLPLIVWGEKPDDFYNRTIHSGNIGVLGLDVVTNYCDLMLSLPKINDTLE